MRATKQSQKKSNKGGEIQSLISNVTEHHGDGRRHQSHLFPIWGEERESISDRDRGLRYTVGEQPQEFKKGIDSVLKDLIKGTWRDYAAQVVTFGDTCLIAAHKGSKESPVQQPKRLSLAGLLGGGLAFFDSQEVPDKAQKRWLRTRVRKHLTAGTVTVLIFIPTWFLESLIADDMPKDWRRWALQNWKEYQKERKNLYEESLREIQELNSMTGFASNDVRSGEFVRAYNIVLMTLTAATAMRTGKSPLEIYSLIRKGQMEMAEKPRDYTGDDVRDGTSDGKLACKYIARTNKEIDEAFTLCPPMFTYLGWEREMRREYERCVMPVES